MFLFLLLKLEFGLSVVYSFFNLGVTFNPLKKSYMFLFLLLSVSFLLFFLYFSIIIIVLIVFFYFISFFFIILIVFFSNVVINTSLSTFYSSSSCFYLISPTSVMQNILFLRCLLKNYLQILIIKLNIKKNESHF